MPIGTLPNVIAQLTRQIQAYHATIQGIVMAPGDLPAQINASDFPLIVCFAGPGVWTPSATGLVELDRIFTTRCYVLPVAQGLTVEEGYSQTLPLLQAIGAAYLYDRTLGGCVNNSDQVSDGGAVILTFNNAQYWGCEFKFRAKLVTLISNVGLPPTPKIDHATVSGPQIQTTHVP